MISEVQQRKASVQMECRRPRIFTAVFLDTLGGDCVARLLDNCFYDLIDAERRRVGTEAKELTDAEYQVKLFSLN